MLDGYRQVEHFVYHEALQDRLLHLHKRMQNMHRDGALSPQALIHIHNFFKIKNIYHSNAIEGNQLTIGETQLVVEMGITITGKSLRDQAEAKNLSHAIDFMKNLATNHERPITINDLRQIHKLILSNIDDDHAGRYRNTEVRISGSKYKPPESHLLPLHMDELGAYIQSVTAADNPNQNLPIVCAAAAHAWLAQIHPFVDGNGRAARILMNLVLMRLGYTICIITREQRLRYYDTLEESQAGDLTPLITLMLENIDKTLKEWQKAR